MEVAPQARPEGLRYRAGCRRNVRRIRRACPAASISAAVRISPVAVWSVCDVGIARTLLTPHLLRICRGSIRRRLRVDCATTEARRYNTATHSTSALREIAVRGVRPNHREHLHTYTRNSDYRRHFSGCKRKSACPDHAPMSFWGCNFIFPKQAPSPRKPFIGRPAVAGAQTPYRPELMADIHASNRLIASLKDAFGRFFEI